LTAAGAAFLDRLEPAYRRPSRVYLAGVDLVGDGFEVDSGVPGQVDCEEVVA